MGDRVWQLVLIVGSAVCAWLGMMWLHEAGHVVAAGLSGGEVERVIWHPLAFSRTDLAENPHPVVVLWGGFAYGAVAPLAVWAVAEAVRLRERWLLRVFAGFCVLANGGYLVASMGEAYTDGWLLVRHGQPRWLVMGVGVAMVVAGLLVCRGMSRRFGFGGRGRVSKPAAVAVACIAVALLVVGFGFGERG